MICYRIVEVKNGNALSLFHGTDGSRILPVNKWIYANKKIVSDGSCATKYLSGFHVFKSVDVAQEFFRKMFRHRENRIIVKCEAVGLRRKSHARGEVYLASRLKICGLTPACS
jgi:hypothetical protein